MKINTKEELENFITSSWNEVNSYLNTISQDLPLPIYSSVDIRESKNKFAPVDNNIYPAGFNNVCALDLNICAERFKRILMQANPTVSHIALIPESHTKNLFYLDHLATLQNCLKKADYQIDIISPDNALFPKGENKIELLSKSGYPLTILKAHINPEGFFQTQDTCYPLVILNNDQSMPLEIEWNTVKGQVLPTPHIGWFQRQKIQHFEYYKKVADNFCQEFDINPNLIQANCQAVHNVDFHAKEGIAEIAQAVQNIQEKSGPETKVFIKASQGTYGMGITVVSSPDEILNLNRKGRNKMDIGKNKIKFTSILVQEGIDTILKFDNHPSEVTIYLIGGQSSGGFIRTNPLKDIHSNLNSKGMVYQKYCISEIHQGHEHKSKEAIYSIIARISTIASAYEINDLQKNK